MYHQVLWNKQIINDFIKQADLSQEESTLIKLRAADKTRYYIAKQLNVSEPTISRMVASLKLKYDKAVEKYKTLPPRRLIKQYQPTYRDFKGYISVGENYIELGSKKFNSLEEVRKYIVTSIEAMSDNEFATLDNAHFKIDIEFDLDIKK